MTCERIDFGDGVTGFVCSRGRRAKCSVPECQHPAEYLCDYLLPWPAPKFSCDANLCRFHAHVQAGRLASDGTAVCHYCPPHHKMAAAEVAA